MFEAAIEAGADDVDSDAEQHVITCAAEDFNTVRDALEQRFGAGRSARLVWRPKNTRRRSTGNRGEPCSSCSRRSRTATMSRTSTPISRWPKTYGASQRLSSPCADVRGSRDAGCLGLDPGLRHTGWGVIDVHGNRLSYVADGVVASRRPISRWRSGSSRCSGSSTPCIERFRPDEAAVEETFVNSNPASTLKLGVARGVALLAPARRGLPVAEYSANLIKKSVVGAGHAEKAQVQMMVRRLLPGLRRGADAADALAVAICHAHHARPGGCLDARADDRQARRHRRADRTPTRRSSTSAASAILPSARRARWAACRRRARRRGC